MSEARDYTLDSETLDNCDVEAAYARWAPIYDLTFSAIFKPGRRALVAAASKMDGPILDVGVGTGLELPMFEPHAQIYGVDLSEHMLRRAAQRVEREGLRHVHGLYKMDATRMGFADATFACVVAPYVLTVVPEPEAMLDELARVVRPGGEIILVNHISRKDDPFAILETWLDRHVAPRLGWRPQFPWSIIGDWVDQRSDMQLVERRLLPPFGLFTLTRIKRLPLDLRAEPEAAPVELEFA
ncbi:class I SAM-dependent methyltransferase [Methylocystis echinoides]|jgi:phosphatidylethanolamine/phosphatidyl-N-methylethanolamine N-methyltransferase|uniref:SAM-dependent methyltransferase n=1 Tax=Methylocystis echinoides TaxID=29468 RepID=A0A9W6GUG7_9HYPH|nr:class I SAM-dependent methyltransferase [Methylocystis echinoides]GLI93153.1 SAM-dependent methyltransferase [Methylocystis echinoides]